MSMLLRGTENSSQIRNSNSGSVKISHAEEPARRLLEGLGWMYVAREAPASERGDQGEVLLKRDLKDLTFEQ